MERPVIRRCSVFTGERSARKGVETTLGRKVGILFRYPINAKADQYSEQNEGVTKRVLVAVPKFNAGAFPGWDFPTYRLKGNWEKKLRNSSPEADRHHHERI